jgi:hypothetical protein
VTFKSCTWTVANPDARAALGMVDVTAATGSR